MEFVNTEMNDRLRQLLQFSFSVENQNISLLEKAEMFRKKGFYDVLAMKEGDDYLASLFLLPLQMRLRESIVPIGGIGAVTSNAYNRGKGAVKRLLKHSLGVMRDKGMILSALHPFSMRFYRKYGWEIFDESAEYVFNPEIINCKTVEKVYKIEYSPAPDRDVMNYYNRYAAHHYNLIQRNPVHWQSDMRDLFGTCIDKKVVSFKDGERVCGLFILRYLKKEENTEINIGTVCYDSQDVFKAMFSFMGSLSLQCKRIRLSLPDDIDIWQYLNEGPEQKMMKQRSMIRVVDVMGLNGLTIVSPDMAFNIGIKDDFAQWNDGCYHLAIKNNRLSVDHSEEAEISCDISVFSSILTGYTSFEKMFECGKVKSLNPSGIVHDFPGRTTFLEYAF